MLDGRKSILDPTGLESETHHIGGGGGQHDTPKPPDTNILKITLCQKQSMIQNQVQWQSYCNSS
jgi:hypothetical protein